MQFDENIRGQRADRQQKATFRVPVCIPLFPLPNVVFFPKTYIPLHVFEPRYREMVADASGQGHCVGMVLLKEGWEDDYYEDPPIFNIGCVGRLISVQKFPDGRSNILLQGLERFEIKEKLGGKSYRQATIDLKRQDKSSRIEPSLRADLLSTLRDSLERQEDPSLFQALSPLDGNDEVLVNALSTYLDFTPLEKQFLLEADTLVQQARRLQDLIHFRRHERDSAQGWG